MQSTENAPIEVLLESIGHNLNQIRLKQNISNEDLSERAGVSRVTLSKLWKGAPVKFDTFLRVIRALGRMDLIHTLLETPEQTPMERLKKGRTTRSTEVPRQRARSKSKDKTADISLALKVGKSRGAVASKAGTQNKLGKVHLLNAPSGKPRAGAKK